MGGRLYEMLCTSLPEEDAVDGATHTSNLPSETIIDRGGEAEDDAAYSCIVERILFCDYHRENIKYY